MAGNLQWRKRIRYCDDAGVCIHVVVPWGDASGNIPPPVVSFGARSFFYDGDELDADGEANAEFFGGAGMT